MIYTFYYTDWRWLFQFCGKKIWFIPMCLPEPKIFLKFPQWWLGDPHFPFYWNIWQSKEWKDTSLSTAYHGWSSSPSLHQSHQSFLQGPGYFFGTGTGKGACISPTSICPWSTWQLSSLAFSQLPLKCWKCCTICIY